MPEFAANPADGGGGGRYAIVAARFNRRITEQLLAGAEQTLAEHGIAPADITRVWVPGAFEIPLACRKVIDALDTSDPDGERIRAVIALGAVIRGETPHFDYVAGECARGIARLSVDTGVPVIFGVLTTDTVEQAERRANPAAGNKGGGAALAALEMAALLRQPFI